MIVVVVVAVAVMAMRLMSFISPPYASSSIETPGGEDTFGVIAWPGIWLPCDASDGPFVASFDGRLGGEGAQGADLDCFV